MYRIALPALGLRIAFRAVLASLVALLAVRTTGCVLNTAIEKNSILLENLKPESVMAGSDDPYPGLSPARPVGEDVAGS